MAEQTLLPDPSCLHLLQLEAEGKIIIATVKTTTQEAKCPLCTYLSEKVHSHYQRMLAELPWVSYAVRLHLSTWRFFCLNAECPRKIFTEASTNRQASLPLDNTAQRSTIRLAECLP